MPPDSTTTTTDEALTSLRELERLAHLAIEAYGEAGTHKGVQEHVTRLRLALTRTATGDR